MFKVVFSIVSSKNGTKKYELKGNSFIVDGKAFKVKNGYKDKYKSLIAKKNEILSYKSTPITGQDSYVEIKFFNDDKVVEINRFYRIADMEEIKYFRLFTACLDEGII